MPGLNLAATISLDGSGFERGMQRVGSSIASGIKNFVVGAVGIYAIQAAIRKTIDTADELVNSARKMSMTTDQLQIMRRAAEINGKSFDQMTLALERFNAVRENILNKGKGWAEQMAAMSRLGITPAALASQTAATSFMGQISTTARGSNAADIANDLKQIFGRNGMELFGTLQTDFTSLGAKMKSMGAIMDTTTAVALKTFKDEMTLLSQIIITSLAPALVAFGRGLIALTSRWAQTSQFVGAQSAEGWKWWITPITTSFNNAADVVAQIQRKQGGDLLTKFDAMIKEIADGLNNPKPPAVTDEPPAEKAKKERALKGDSNALIKVGNFLGASRDTIGNLQQQTAQHAAATASNTASIKTSTAAAAKTLDQLTAELLKAWPTCTQDAPSIFPTS